MKFLFLLAPTGFNVRYHPGIAYIAAVLEQNGYHDIVYYDTKGKTEEELASYLKKFQPDICGYPLLTPYRENTFLLTEFVKRILPNTLNVVGNVHATVLYDQVLRHNPSIDVAVIGEGERTFLELAQTVERGGDLSSVRGLALRRNGGVYFTGSRELYKKLEEIPLPAFHLFDLKDQNAFTIVGSRGCPNRCNFCSTPQFWVKRYRIRAASNILSEIEYLCNNYDVKSIKFDDDNFIVHTRRVIEICDAILKSKRRFSWHCKGSIRDLVRRDKTIARAMLSKMREAGCHELLIGIESGSPAILKNLVKDCTVEEQLEGLRLVKESGMRTSQYIMLGSPGETNETIAETIDFFKRAKLDKIDYQMISAGMTKVYPGTALYEDCKKKGYLDDSYWIKGNYAPLYSFEHDIATLNRFKKKIYLHIFWHMGLKAAAQKIWHLLHPKRSGGLKGDTEWKRFFWQLSNLVIKRKKGYTPFTEVNMPFTPPKKNATTNP